jgi:uncharacterized membrane protein YgdD (TMEM256/DUF423 family)
MTYRWVLDWMIGFIGILYAALGTTGNCSAITNRRTLQFTSANARFRSLHTPVVVSCQWICSTLTETSNHT